MNTFFFFQKQFTAIFSALILAIAGAMLATPAFAKEQSAAADFVGKTCAGNWKIVASPEESLVGHTGTLSLQVANVQDGQVSGEVLDAEPSPLPFPHDFAGAVNGSSAKTTTDHGVMYLEFNGNGTLGGSALVAKNKKIGQSEVELEFDSMTCSS